MKAPHHSPPHELEHGLDASNAKEEEPLALARMATSQPSYERHAKHGDSAQLDGNSDEPEKDDRRSRPAFS